MTVKKEKKTNLETNGNRNTGQLRQTEPVKNCFDRGQWTFQFRWQIETRKLFLSICLTFSIGLYN